MELRVIHSTQNCDETSCPTIYKTEAGNFVIQGFKINPEDKTKLNVPESEDLVEIPAEFLKAFIEKMA